MDGEAHSGPLPSQHFGAANLWPSQPDCRTIPSRHSGRLCFRWLQVPRSQSARPYRYPQYLLPAKTASALRQPRRGPAAARLSANQHTHMRDRTSSAAITPTRLHASRRCFTQNSSGQSKSRLTVLTVSTRGENPAPGKDVHGELDRTPDQDQMRHWV